MTDNINQPAHYTAGGIETIDVIEQVFNKVDHRDQVEKYNQRAHLKGNFKQDLEKARWYLNRTIENCEKGLLDPGTGARVTPTEELPELKFASVRDTDSIYKDDDGDFWVYTDGGWRWHYISNGELLYSSIRLQGFNDIEETYSLVKLSDDDTRLVRRIIQEGEI